MTALDQFDLIVMVIGIVHSEPTVAVLPVPVHRAARNDCGPAGVVRRGSGRTAS
jgi:hypothetical protein